MWSHEFGKAMGIFLDPAAIAMERDLNRIANDIKVMPVRDQIPVNERRRNYK